MTATPFERLPSTVIPVNYDLELTPNLTTFKFDGKVVIDVKVNEPNVTTVLCNSAELQFDSVTFEKTEGNVSLKSTQVKLDDETELATITFGEALPQGEGGRLLISFVGDLNDNMKGFYRSKYTHPNGETRFCATTQFEAADARRAFPCWDEPALKATFDVTIYAEADKTVLSNMPVISETEDKNNLKKFKFDRTPIMSTYLLAFIVGEYDYVEAKDANGVLIRVYTPQGKKEQGQFALDVAVKTLPFYVDYFKIDYPLPKLDMIALADFAAGAMENWGLVTYRETALLIDSVNSSIAAKQRVAIVVGHELAHQWFGNIVTMEWWTHLWLNEGFASWIEYLCVDYCLPELEIWTYFVTSDYCRALELDSLKSSHPIEVPVGPPSEVDEIFDVISYSKGCTTIRMLHAYIGDKAFREGLHNYLEKFKYKNTLTEDLWDALSAASGKPVNDIMEMWTKQTGYPYLNVSTRVDEKTKETLLKVKQERFFSNGSKPTPEEDFKWKVPITVMTKSSGPEKVHKEYLLEKVEDEINLGVLSENDWIKLNKNTVGMFRTNYSPEMLAKLVPLIEEQSIHPTDRLGMQSDVFALNMAGLMPASEVLKFVQAFAKAETNSTVWCDLISNLLGMSHLLLNTDFHPEMQAFIRQLLKPISQKLTFSPIEGESDLTRMCRSTIFRTLGTNGDKDVIEEAKKKFALHVAGTEFIPADLRAAVYATVLYDESDDGKVVDQLIALHDKSDLQEEKVRIIVSMGAARTEKLINKVLDFAVSKSVRAQDTVSVFCSVAQNSSSKLSTELAWKYVKDNWALLYGRYSTGFLITRLIKSCIENFSSEEMAKDAENFFKTNPVPAAKRSIEQGLESISVNSSWIGRNKDAMKTFFANSK